MEIEERRKYKPKIGDILSWESDYDKILFIVIENKTNKLIGITLADSRYRDKQAKSHIVNFTGNKELNKRLSVISKIENNHQGIDKILAKWHLESET